MDIILYCNLIKPILLKESNGITFTNDKNFLYNYNVLNGKCVIKCEVQSFFRIFPAIDFNTEDNIKFVGEGIFNEEKNIIEKSLFSHEELKEIICKDNLNKKDEYDIDFGLELKNIQLLDEFLSQEHFSNNFIIKLSSKEIYQILTQNKTLIIKNKLPKELIKYFDWRKIKPHPLNLQIIGHKYRELLCPYCYKILFKLTKDKSEKDFSLKECPRCNFKFEK